MEGQAQRSEHPGNMAGLLAAALAALDLAFGIYLLWFARHRQQQCRESVAVVGLVLVIISAALGVLAWQGEHLPAVTVRPPDDGRRA